MEDLNILVIEDSPDYAKDLEKILADLGYKVWIVADSHEGVKLLKSRPFVVSLAELRMPSLGGNKLVQEIYKVSPTTSILTITPAAFMKSAIETMEAGAYGYVIRPFHPTEIKIMVRRAIEHSYLLMKTHERTHYKNLSIRDPLTGVYNKRHLINQLSKRVAVSLQTMTQFSVLMIDLDDFKKYNDTEGHPAGDELLKNMCRLFVKGIRKGDEVYRYGGEEFVIFLVGADKNTARLIGDRVRMLVEFTLPRTISMGIATFPEDAQDSSAMISKADQALYQAKNTGKNKICLA